MKFVSCNPQSDCGLDSLSEGLMPSAVLDQDIMQYNKNEPFEGFKSGFASLKVADQLPEPA